MTVRDNFSYEWYLKGFSRTLFNDVKSLSALSKNIDYFPVAHAKKSVLVHLSKSGIDNAEYYCQNR